MITPQDIQFSYQYFYQKVYSAPKYKFSYTETSQKLVTKFLQFCDKKWKIQTLGENFLWNYLLFQFQYWDGLEIVSFNNKINFSFIFGEKAYKRYVDRDVEYDWQLQESNLVSKYKITQDDFSSLFSKSQSSVFYQNPTRLIGLNTLNGLNNCLEFTTLYDFKDVSCILCKYKEECKKLLETNYPDIYKSRNYGKTIK